MRILARSDIHRGVAMYSVDVDYGYRLSLRRLTVMSEPVQEKYGWLIDVIKTFWSREGERSYRTEVVLEDIGAATASEMFPDDFQRVFEATPEAKVELEAVVARQDLKAYLTLIGVECTDADLSQIRRHQATRALQFEAFCLDGAVITTNPKGYAEQKTRH